MERICKYIYTYIYIKNFLKGMCIYIYILIVKNNLIYIYICTYTYIYIYIYARRHIRQQVRKHVRKHDVHKPSICCASCGAAARCWMTDGGRALRHIR